MASGVDFEDIYRHHAEEYHALITAEDRDGHLLPALVGLAPLAGATVLEVGAGTGRVTGLLLAAGARVVATERAPAMLEVARRQLGPPAQGRCALVCADARALPVRADWADVALAGWVFGHMRAWHAATWRDEVERGLAGMDRALALA